MNNYMMFIIETLSNMHVGSGETHFGVVDNLIQRHPVTRIPIIHASGIKGSMREYFESYSSFSLDEIVQLFGGKVDIELSDRGSSLDFSPGHLIFFEAQMLTIPLRASENVYYDSTSIPLLMEYLEYLNDFFNAEEKTKVLNDWFSSMEQELKNKDFVYFYGSDNLEIEDFTEGKKLIVNNGNIKTALNDLCKIEINKLAIFNKDIFTRICTDSIPVIARNQIKEDGTSGNLFYEEILPRKTKLFFMIGFDNYLNSNDHSILKNKFIQNITKENNIYQFGANFSVGYGFSKLIQVNL
ncbi:MAG: type III-B CRISPR module RAMP protein Cmr4 [Candidatus Aenigmatarchaeota archaeon]